MERAHVALGQTPLLHARTLSAHLLSLTIHTLCISEAEDMKNPCPMPDTRKVPIVWGSPRDTRESAVRNLTPGRLWMKRYWQELIVARHGRSEEHSRSGDYIHLLHTIFFIGRVSYFQRH